ncbi:hypothetical protein ACEXQD_14030 [Herbiconiux sp. P15]|uniref:hypothetical protein n=1 Tax=Herbiconiux liukaitaii TaxID=3342799 RepID=UPI0035B79019
MSEPDPPAAIILGQTIDEVGAPHTLVLSVAGEAGAALLHNTNAFAVISGSCRFSVTGDAAVDDWRFTVDASNAGTESPTVVIKNAPGRSMQDLAADPRAFTFGAALNEDPVAISTRLSKLIAEVISKAEPTQPDRSFYTSLAQHVADPSWTGVMIFNASATVPAEVRGQSTGALADSEVGVLNLGFEAPVIRGDPGPSRVFATIDQAADSGDALPPGVRYLRAGFFDSALTAFEQG